jgi:hypothetical protein
VGFQGLHQHVVHEEAVELVGAQLPVGVEESVEKTLALTKVDLRNCRNKWFRMTPFHPQPRARHALGPMSCMRTPTPLRGMIVERMQRYLAGSVRTCSIVGAAHTKGSQVNDRNLKGQKRSLTIVGGIQRSHLHYSH